MYTAFINLRDKPGDYIKHISEGILLAIVHLFQF